MNKRFHLKFNGRVQGVGFRYTAYNLALWLGLTGWVRNEWDGSVSMEVQGTEEKIEQFINKIQSERFIRVDSINKEELPLVSQEGSFNVEY